MLPGFIESLIKKWPSLRGLPEKGHESNADLTRPLDAETIRLVTAFWYDAIRFVALDDLLKQHANAPELTFEQAAAGRVTRAAPKDQSDDDGDDRGREIVVTIGLAPCDWWRLEGKSTKARYLLAIPARQNSNGHFIPAGTEAPFFNPKRIQSNDERNDVFVTRQEIINDWMDAHPLPLAQEWSPLWAYALGMLTGAVLEPTANLDAARESLARALGLTMPQDWIVKIVPAAATNESTAEVARVYRYLLESDEKVDRDIKTYHRLMTGVSGRRALAGDEAARADAEALGHIDAFKPPVQGANVGFQTREIFPLDPSQRQVVRHACRLGEGEILAVNGPPGTGKTATLRAVIGSYWVRAALTQDRPPIIVGCGATNQAVTNITEAFIDAAHQAEDYPLAQRWNPFVNSYGMFFASDTFAKDNPEKVKKYQGFQRSRSIKDRCLFTLREARNPFSPNELAELTDSYLQKAADCTDIHGADVASITVELRALLKIIAIDIPHYLRQATARASSGARCNLLADERIKTHVLPLIARQNKFAQQRTFLRLVAYARAPSPDHVKEIMTDAECDEAEAARLLVETVIDCTLRPHAFHIAARYWEGRFLESAAVRLYTRSEENLKDALQRSCMLAPCIVSTVNSLPKLFSIENPNPDCPRHFAYGMADLLIMDESGQAVPEAGAACFALAKRALVVGDLKQLEPVATIQPQNEIAILARHKAIGEYTYLVDTFKTPSSGSVLAMAQLASSYHDRFGNGLTLLFHYRCVQPIIEFCNRLSYGGHLKAKTGDGAEQWPPPLAWVETAAAATKRSGSWVNEREAREIAAWLRSAWPRIHAEDGGKSTIDRLVAVLSAFRPQIEALRTAIGEAFENPPKDAPSGTQWPNARDLQAMTIGTVHSLQGAERPIVIFSGAVSNENTTAPFFDSSPSILNVAVSRAKKSFIYFGDPSLLFRYDRDGALTSGKPSAILGDHMRQHPFAKRLYPLYLVIVEAPGKSRVISEILGKDYEVFATGGAIREIASDDLGLGFDRGLRPRWKWRERPDKPLADDFARLAGNIDSYEAVFIATDADMEGEAIAWHVTEVLAEIAGARVWNMVRRVRLGDITRPALMQAFATPGVVDRNIASAAIARAIADRLIADHMASATNRRGIGTEAAREAALASSLLPLTSSGTRGRVSHYHPGRVQGGILRLVYDAARRDAEAMARLGRFRISAKVRFGEGAAEGHLVLPGPEFRIDAPDPEAARQKLQAIIAGKLPQRIDGYEHDGVTSIDHDLGLPPFLSTIEIMRRAIRHGLMPWHTMQALQNLYLGQIMKSDYLGEEER